MKLSEIQQLFARDVATLFKYMEEKGFKYTFAEAYRTPEQAELYAKQGKGIKDSLHCKRLAIDINLFDSDGKFLEDAASHKQFGEFWESLSPMNRWGGKVHDKNGNPFPDANHYERNEKQS
jgi:hypothetical protein